jgi:putative oxidoreductase
LFRQLERNLEHHTPSGPLASRLALGVVFVAHAYLKAAILGLPTTARFFATQGFPGWTAYPVFLAELLGGIALLAGFQTRIVSLALVPVMLGALKPHLANGFFFSEPGGGWEYVAFLVAALVAQAFAGAGAFSADERRERAIRARAMSSHFSDAQRGGPSRAGHRDVAERTS